mmetsp:Transcript_13047/g.38349  ORF Transcript_13047/g.38349 Transcript_13047/m.38349 type:complete len:211 (-) Transcript_13047:1890-2522(-)
MVLAREPPHHPVAGRFLPRGVLPQRHGLEFGAVVPLPCRVAEVVERGRGPLDGVTERGEGPAAASDAVGVAGGDGPLRIEEGCGVQESAADHHVGQAGLDQSQVGRAAYARIVGRVGVDELPELGVARLEFVLVDVAVVAGDAGGLDAIEARAEDVLEGRTARARDLPEEGRVVRGGGVGDFGEVGEGVPIEVLGEDVDKGAGVSAPSVF